MSEKKKKTFQKRFGTIPFALMWAGTYGLAWLIFFGFYVYVYDFMFQTQFDILPEVLRFALSGAMIGTMMAIPQQILLKLQYHLDVRRWRLWSILGWILSGLSFWWVVNWSNFPDDSLFSVALVIGGIFALPSIFQAWLLRHNIKRRWMLPFAAMISAATFILPLWDGGGNDIIGTLLFGLAGSLQGLVMAITLIWVFGMTRTQPQKNQQMDKTKNNLAESDFDSMSPEEVMRYMEMLAQEDRK